MKSILVVMAAAGVLAAGAAQAQAGADVLKSKGCLNCHAMDKKKVGPAYKDVAAKYKGDKGAEDALVAKLRDGKGQDGKMHMKIKASDAELHAAVQAVLGAK